MNRKPNSKSSFRLFSLQLATAAFLAIIILSEELANGRILYRDVTFYIVVSIEGTLLSAWLLVFSWYRRIGNSSSSQDQQER
jgi:hypothetical protein